MSGGGFSTCFAFTLGQESGYSNDPDDPGNWTEGKVGQGSLVGTCWGISAPTMISWVGPRSASIVDADYMKSLTLATARMIYRIRYWNALRCEDLAAGVDLAVWDFGVNAGVSTSAKCLQMVVKTETDGIIGVHTLAAAGTFVSTPLIRALVFAHDRYYRSINDSKHLAGWLNRQAALLTAALAMTGDAGVTKA